MYLPLLPLLHLKVAFFWANLFETLHRSYMEVLKDYIWLVVCCLMHMHSFSLYMSKIIDNQTIKPVAKTVSFICIFLRYQKAFKSLCYPITKSFFCIMEQRLMIIHIYQMICFFSMRVVRQPVQCINIILLKLKTFPAVSQFPVQKLYIHH